MRLKELTVFSQYFRFILEDKPASYSSFLASVIYDNERQTVTCNCLNGASACEHKVFIHEMLKSEKDETTLRYFEDCREDTAQTITPETLNRIRGAFAREYNLAKGVVQYPEPSPRGPRAPLGWQGKVPGYDFVLRVVQVPNRIPDSFAVFDRSEDQTIWRTVTGVDDPQCNGYKCKRGCEHEKAVKEAVRSWRANGLMPGAQSPLTIVEKAEPITRTGKVEGVYVTVPPGFNGTWTLGFDRTTANDAMEQAVREAARRAWESAIWNTGGSGTTAADVDFDSKKFEEDMKKAKEILEKKEKPKPEKPKKPRTRFTDLEL